MDLPENDIDELDRKIILVVQKIGQEGD